MERRSCEVCIIGGGPAGLSAAYELGRHGIRDILLVDGNDMVGGLSRTMSFEGNRFDVGPHRFFTKSTEVNRIWHDLLDGDFRPVERLTRIYYKKKLFSYPIKAPEALIKLGPVESANAMISYLAARLGRKGRDETFEDWMIERFGRRFYETFFRTYTEKVWGIPCSRIGAEWASQRIKGLDLLEVIRNAALPRSKNRIKTLVEQFDYPRLGAGQMYEAMCTKVVEQGAEIVLNQNAEEFWIKDGSIQELHLRGREGEKTVVVAGHYFSSIPLTHLMKRLRPEEPEEILEAASALYYRDHITVNLLVGREDLFPDQWIYAHAPEVKMARVANYRNFSSEMAEKGKSTLGVEYFVFKGDEIWNRSDEALRAMAVEELAEMGLARRPEIERAWVVRETECYPMYFIGYEKHYRAIKRRIDCIDNVHVIGRGGMYKYNNQDHSIMTGLLAARNWLGMEGTPYDLWEINMDAEYQEGSQRR